MESPKVSIIVPVYNLENYITNVFNLYYNNPIGI